nr:MAG TPA: hypothetical protein [Caudoviricetes sp.]
MISHCTTNCSTLRFFQLYSVKDLTKQFTIHTFVTLIEIRSKRHFLFTVSLLVNTG